MGKMKGIQIEIDNSKPLQYILHEIQQLTQRTEKIEAMLDEICHNPYNPQYVERLYVNRYEK